MRFSYRGGARLIITTSEEDLNKEDNLKNLDDPKKEDDSKMKATPKV